MKIYITVDNGGPGGPQQDPKIRRLEQEGWRLVNVRFPQGPSGETAEVELTREPATDREPREGGSSGGSAG